MIVEIVATCLLAAGQTYTPPEGWRIEQVGIQGRLDVGGRALLVYPIERSFVTLRRPAKVGERIEAPAGCDVQVETR